MYDKTQLIDDIITDWSYKVSDGKPDINNFEHRMILKDVLVEHDIPTDAIGLIIQNLVYEKQILQEVDSMRSITGTAIYNRGKTHMTGSGHSTYYDPSQMQNILPTQDSEEEEEELEDDGQTTAAIETYQFDKEKMAIIETGDTISLEDVLTENKFKCFMTGEIYCEQTDGLLVKENEYNNLNEAITRGTQLENAIISRWDGTVYESDKELDEIAVNIVSKLKNIGITGKSKHLGSGTVDTTAEWKQYGANDRTPKTDIILGKNNISLKWGKSQLMSGGKAESLATFMTSVGDIPNIQNDIVNNIVNELNNFVESGHRVMGTVKDALQSDSSKIKDIKQKSEVELLKKANESHKIMLSNMQTLFSSNSNFGTVFVKEAMSGKHKFGKSSVGFATKLLAISGDGKTYKYSDINDAIAGKIAGKMKPSVRFKSVSVKKSIGGEKIKTGEYNFWSVVSLITKDLNEGIENSDKLIVEGKFTDFIKNIIKKIKKLIIKIKKYLKEGFNEIIKYLDIDISVNTNTIIDVSSII